MKTSKCQKWQSPNSSCLQWAPAAFLQVSFWNEPLRIPGPGKAGWWWGHVTAFSLLQSVRAQLQDPQVLCSWGPLSPQISGLSFMLEVLCCESTFLFSPHTTKCSLKRAENNKIRIQEFICYNSAGGVQFSRQYKTTRHNSASPYTKLLLFLCYHF